MRLPNQKLRLLYIMQFLMENTDEEHQATVGDILEMLGANGISAERKTIYDDIEQLRLFGIDILSQRGRNCGYYVTARDFELPELKILVDSIQSSKFISQKKSMQLISKLEKLASNHEAQKLHRQVYVVNRVKTPNEKVYYNIDAIQDALVSDKKITFTYYEWTVDKKQQPRKDGKLYCESPLALVWDDENYYMISFNEKYQNLTHYRVDKMDKITITADAALHPEEKFDPAKYAKRVFAMFGGEESSVTVKFKNYLVGSVIDRFGIDVPIIKIDDEHFKATLKVEKSPHFFSWLIAFSGDAEVMAPDDAVDDMKKLLEKNLEAYKK